MAFSPPFIISCPPAWNSVIWIIESLFQIPRSTLGVIGRRGYELSSIRARRRVLPTENYYVFFSIFRYQPHRIHQIRFDNAENCFEGSFPAPELKKNLAYNLKKKNSKCSQPAALSSDYPHLNDKCYCENLIKTPETKKIWMWIIR